jgi:hypothetical protein
MARLRELVDQVLHRIGLDRPRLALAQNRYAANRKRAYRAHARQGRHQTKADALRSAGHLAAAAGEDKAVARCRVRASKNHARAQHFLGVIKLLTQRIEGLETTEAHYEAELKKIDTVSISVLKNKAKGGTVHERLKAVALKSASLCASGKRTNFYSQAGDFDIEHCLTGPSTSHRDDCSSWFTSVYWSSGQHDPNGEGYVAGYTGTLVSGGHQVDRAHLRPGDAVIYGSGAGHHVEMFVGPGDKTIGHGSAPVDAGVIDLFGDGDYRFFSY